MFECYCPTCKKIVDRDEIDMQEVSSFIGGEYAPFHLLCDTQLEETPTGKID